MTSGFSGIQDSMGRCMGDQDGILLHQGFEPFREGVVPELEDGVEGGVIRSSRAHEGHTLDGLPPPMEIDAPGSLDYLIQVFGIAVPGHDRRPAGYPLEVSLCPGIGTELGDIPADHRQIGFVSLAEFQGGHDPGGGTVDVAENENFHWWRAGGGDINLLCRSLLSMRPTGGTMGRKMDNCIGEGLGG